VPQDQKSGAAAVKYGLDTARKIAKTLGAVKVGNERSNEYDWGGRLIVIKCARANTRTVGVPYHMLKKLDAVIGSFETGPDTYELYEMAPQMFVDNMKPTRSKGPSAGRVGVVRRSTFLNECQLIRTIKLGTDLGDVGSK
jgi:hypothetical protein